VWIKGEETNTMSANDRQIGGYHYRKTGYQTWDYIELNGLGFLEGNAIKYVTRWRDKGGASDLDKAEHYVDKLTEMFLAGTRKARCNVDPDQTSLFCSDGAFSFEESMFITNISSWSCAEDLTRCKDWIAYIRKEANLGNE
jgi:hypothetical protein